MIALAAFGFGGTGGNVNGLSLGRAVAVRGGAALRIPDFRRLALGAAFNQVGWSGEQVIVGLLVFQITASTAWVGVAVALYTLPMLVFGLLSGAVSDWLDRRTLLRAAELVLAGNLLLFAGLTAAGLTELWLVLAFVAVSGSARALYSPVRTAYAYDLAGGDRVVAALGLLNLFTRFGQLAGALLAGAVMGGLGAPAAVLCLALAHGLAFATVSRLRTAGDSAPTERAGIRQNLREYIAEMRGNRTLLMLVLLTATVEVFGFSFSTALPELATSRFGVGAEGLGVMHGARATGGIVASLALAGLGGLRRRGPVYLGVIYAFGVSLWLLALSGAFLPALAALMLVAALAVASDVLTQSMIQVSVANRLRGRAMGSWVLAVGSAPLGHLEMGALAVTIGVGGALAINGAALIAVGVAVTLAAPRLRQL